MSFAAKYARSNRNSLVSSSLILLKPAIRLLTVLINVELVMSERNAIRMQNANSRLLMGFALLEPTPSCANAQFKQTRY